MSNQIELVRCSNAATLREHQRTVGGLRLSLMADDRALDAVDMAFSLFETAQTEGMPIEPGLRVGLGFSELQLFMRDGELWICEPHFTSNPFMYLHDDVTLSLSLFLSQLQFTSTAGVEPEPTPFDTKILLVKGAFTYPRLIFRREEPSGHEGDSGWFLTPEGVDSDDLEVQYVFELVKQRLAMTRMLLLPVGFSGLFDGKAMVNVWTPDGQPLL